MEHSGNTLRIDATEIELPAAIAEVVELDDAVVVQLDTLCKADRLDTEVYRRNVRCLERDGRTRWLIERAEPIGGHVSPYTGLWKDDDALWAYNWNGVAYEVDPTDGSLRDSQLMK